jgi:hypothetical protein
MSRIMSTIMRTHAETNQRNFTATTRFFLAENSVSALSSPSLEVKNRVRVNNLLTSRLRTPWSRSIYGGIQVGVRIARVWGGVKTLSNS